ncbi:DNA circularization N-terminal domain-containing protein [Bosea sp. TND4EK4]|uniref:DNA circularization N-terminal domain-containing protein n=1 Tax=Bosea sp. TND4EK4 TaxID=1907408 RepID=UPI000954B2D9|nr:DNA circularization N-terminal domain-containing protein [Bosea sp. TND4EK4]SIP96274.1 Mu-like prophage DNA circulation protein [Bosea sp. TND4EK4]
MSLFDDADGLLPGLMPAAWRGQRFWVINAQHSVGRRIHQVLFPGLDLKTHDDTGPLDGPIRMSGLVIGDDYIAQAQALHAAFRAPGPATLVHPWRGPIRCVLFRPANIEFDVKELRVARIDAEFDPVVTGAGAIATLGALLSSLSVLTGAAVEFARFALAASPMAAAIYGRAIAAVSASVSIAGGWASQASRSSALMPAVTAANAAVTVALSLPARSDRAAALAAVPADLASAVSVAYRPQPASGIGAGPAAAAAPVADPRAGATLLMSIATDIGRRLRPSESVPLVGLSAIAPAELPTSVAEKAVLLAAEAECLAEAARLVVQIPFNARQDAQAYAATIDDRLRRGMTSASALASDQVAPAAALWRALGEARARLAADLSETIGRLPAVQRITPPGNASALLLAQHLAGDDPKAVFGYAQDIVRRNRLRHPASLGAGPIEVLL